MDEDENACWGLRLLGARLLGPSPISDVWFPFSAGVHALYGLNGAGKSRLLYRLADLLAGRPGDGYLVATPAPAERAWSWGGFDFLGPDIQDIPEHPEHPWEAPDRPSTQRLTGRELWGALFEDEPDRLRWVEFIDDVVRQDLFALWPTGRGWQATPAVIQDGSSELSRGIQALREMLPHLSERSDLTPPDDSYEEQTRLVESAKTAIGISHMDSGVGLFSAIFEGLRDPDLETLQEQLALLDRAPVVPYALGFGDVFGTLNREYELDGPAARLVRDDDVDPASLTDRTKKRLWAEWVSRTDRPVIDQQGRLEAAFASRANEIGREAQALYERLLLHAPTLMPVLANPDRWFVDDPFRWLIDASPKQLALDDLSQAQRRWALTSIAVTEASYPWPEGVDEDGQQTEVWSLPRDLLRETTIIDSPLVVILDEPDAALHATAQRQCVEGLVEVCKDTEAMVVVATHSQEFLNHPSVTAHHVSRDGDNRVTIAALQAPQRARLEELGLEPADLLMLHRSIVVVEGSHDQVVLDVLIGDELDRLRVLVLPIRGGRLLATVVDSHVLAHLSDLPVIAALDNLQGEKIRGFWEDLQAHSDEGQVGFDAIVKAHFSNRERDEETFLINYCRAAAELGQSHRFQVFGFAEADIPEYLPVEVIVPGADSWAELRAEFAEQKKPLAVRVRVAGLITSNQ